MTTMMFVPIHTIDAYIVESWLNTGRRTSTHDTYLAMEIHS